MQQLHHGLIVEAIVAHDAPAAGLAGLRHMNPGDGAPGVKNLILTLPPELLD